MASFLDLQGLKRFYTNLTTSNISLTGNYTYKYNTQTSTIGGQGILLADTDTGSTLSLHNTGIIATNGTANKVFATDGTLKDLSAYDKVVDNVFPFKLSSFSVSPNVVEKGVSTDVTFNWGYPNSEHTINSQTIKIGSNLSSGAVTKTAAASLRTLKVAGADTATLFSTVQNLPCLMTSTNAAGKSVITQNTVYVVNPSYYGILSSKTTPTSFSGLSKQLRTSCATTLSNVTLDNQYLIYMYPATYADLTSITDGVLPYLGAFDKGTTTINGVSYKYYIKSTAGNITWATLTFK